MRFRASNNALVTSPEVVCTGDDLEASAIALIRRRIIEAGRRASPQLPLAAAPGAEVLLDDLVLLLAGKLNETRILSLARPLMAMDWYRFQSQKAQGVSVETIGSLSLYGVLRLAHWPRPLRIGSVFEPVSTRLDPAIFSRLATGDLSGAVRTAIHRLTVSGLRPHLRQAVGDPVLARRLAMALAFPIRDTDATALARRLVHPSAGASQRGSSNTAKEPNRKEATKS